LLAWLGYGWGYAEVDSQTSPAVAGLVVQPGPSGQGLGFFPCHERAAVSGSDEWQVESAGDFEFEREPVWSSIGAGECGAVAVGEQRREGDGVR
jgi:hypothetical protein